LEKREFERTRRIFKLAYNDVISDSIISSIEVREGGPDTIIIEVDLSKVPEMSGYALIDALLYAN
jgi:hypothetical protein